MLASTRISRLLDRRSRESVAIKIERPGFSLYIPITIMLLLSFSLSSVMWLIGKLIR
ncbi:MAG: DUF2905 family protein [Xenococcaceae cyanobacterium]